MLKIISNCNKSHYLDNYLKVTDNKQIKFDKSKNLNQNFVILVILK